jgi:AraC-like DNA-binding protein
MISSRNYPSAPKLLPFLRRHYIFAAALPPDFELEDFLLADNAFVRILIDGDWAWWDGDHWVELDGPLLFGTNAHAIKVRVRGPFSVASFAIRPSAWTSLFETPATDFVDRIVPLAEGWGQEAADALARGVRAATTDEACIAAMDAAVLAQLDRIGRNEVDPVLASFEAIARNDSTIRVDDAAQLLGLSPRQLERRCLAGFGLSPKSVLQRCRFLDMAAAIRGQSAAGEAELAALRFFDQSHLNREFRRYTGMTPGAFQRAVTPLFDASLHLRVEGKQLA